MNRITARLEALKTEGRKALVTYIVCGDPAPEATLPTMHELVAQGADIIELGVPFSDPMADGPVIQLAHERALAHNISLTDALAVVEEFRQTDSDTPVVLMGYANPVERMGYQTVAQRAQAAGVDGFLTVDLPPEEAADFNAELAAVDLKNVFLLAPTTSEARAQRIIPLASGFLYYVSLKGVTGAGHLDIDSVVEKVTEIRQLTDLPLCVGFGIKDGDSARQVAAVSDGVVVGSALVGTMGALSDASPADVARATGAILAPIRKALDETPAA